MTNENNHIDDFFKGFAEDYSEKTPSYAWKNLSESLDKKKRKKAIIMFYRVAAGIALLIGFGAGYFISFKNSPEPANVISENRVNNQSLSQNTDIQSNESEISAYDLFNPPMQVKSNPNSENTGFYPKKPKNPNRNSTPLILIANQITPVSKPDSVLKHIDNVVFAIEDIQTKEPAKTFTKQDTIRLMNDLFNQKPVIANLDDTVYPESVEKLTKWYFGGAISPAYAFGSTGGNGQKNYDAVSQNSVNNAYTSNETGIVSYSAGLNIGRDINKIWGFQSGFYFSRFGQSSEAFSFGKTTDNSYFTNTSAGKVTTTSPGSFANYSGQNSLTASSSNEQIVQYFDFVEVPLVAKLKHATKAADFYITGGANTSFLVANNTYLSSGNQKESIGKTQNLSPLLIGGVAGCGVEFRTKFGNSIYFEPSFKYSLNSINKNNTFSFHPWMFGVYSGVRFKGW